MLTNDEVKRLAKLSRIKLTNDEIEAFRQELDTILDYVAQLQVVDTTDVEPTSQVTGLTNVMREDEEIDYGADHVALLQNAPEKEKRYIKVKRVLG